ncbi:hypothetical protein ACLOJK_031688 [Asimina triloba]
MKPSRMKLPLSIIAIIACAFALALLSYREDVRALSSLLKRTPFYKAAHAVTTSIEVAAENNGKSTEEDDFLDSERADLDPKPFYKAAHVVTTSIEVAAENNGNATKEDDFLDSKRRDFDPNTCDITNGKWVFNPSIKPLYTDRTCPYIDLQLQCTSNGRPDDDYLHWEWQPEECSLPRSNTFAIFLTSLSLFCMYSFISPLRFDAALVLKKLRGKRLMFVGDSLQRGQWESFVCMVSSHIPEGQGSMKQGKFLSVFTAKECNASIEFYWAPYLIKSNTDDHIIADTKKRIVRLDSIFDHAKNWVGADILVFNSYVWWMSSPSIKILLGSFPNGEDGVLELDTEPAYRIALQTWANWVDSTVNPNKTRVFFSSVSSTHIRSADWHNENGIRCYNETKPVMEKGFWGSSDRRKMQDVASTIARMKVPVTFLNITQMTEYRIDGHVSVYTESQGKVLTAEQKADPQSYADCIHWCLPGVPDTWNRLFFAYL